MARTLTLIARILSSPKLAVAAFVVAIAALAVYADEIEAALTGVSTAWRTGPVVLTSPAEFAAFRGGPPVPTAEQAAAMQRAWRAKRTEE